MPAAGPVPVRVEAVDTVTRSIAVGRACFVGVCRAETHLTLTRIEQYRGFRKPPSIFLEEMGIDPYD